MNILKITYDHPKQSISTIDQSMVDGFRDIIAGKLEQFVQDLINCSSTVVITINSGMTNVKTKLKNIPDELEKQILDALRKKDFDYSQN